MPNHQHRWLPVHNESYIVHKKSDYNKETNVTTERSYKGYYVLCTYVKRCNNAKETNFKTHKIIIIIIKKVKIIVTLSIKNTAGALYKKSN